MNNLFNTIIYLLIGGFSLIILYEFYCNRKMFPLVMQILLLSAVLLILLVYDPFGEQELKIPFGGETDGYSLGQALLLVFPCAIAGIIAQVIHYSEVKDITWNTILKPILITPLVVLPLLGTAYNPSGISEFQFASIGFFAFQNGFLWREVLKKGRIITPSKS